MTTWQDNVVELLPSIGKVLELMERIGKTTDPEQKKKMLQEVSDIYKGLFLLETERAIKALFTARSYLAEYAMRANIVSPIRQIGMPLTEAETMVREVEKLVKNAWPVE